MSANWVQYPCWHGEGELTDEQFARLAPHLPPQMPRTGRPAKDHRTVIEGILWVLCTGAPGRAHANPGSAVSRQVDQALHHQHGPDQDDPPRTQEDPVLVIR